MTACRAGLVGAGVFGLTGISRINPAAITTAVGAQQKHNGHARYPMRTLPDPRAAFEHGQLPWSRTPSVLVRRSPIAVSDLGPPSRVDGSYPVPSGVMGQVGRRKESSAMGYPQWTVVSRLRWWPVAWWWVAQAVSCSAARTVAWWAAAWLGS